MIVVGRGKSPNREATRSSSLTETERTSSKKAGDEYGDTIARVELVQKGRSEDDGESSAWDDLAMNVRYSSGEELYERDCPTLKKHGQERS